MNSGTFASDALPDTPSFGMMMSASTVIVAISWAVKKVSVVNFLSLSVSHCSRPVCSSILGFSSLLSVDLQAATNTVVLNAVRPKAFIESRLFIFLNVLFFLF
ncbi:hypothetical protein FQZ97_488080 [compost metagenome]